MFYFPQVFLFFRGVLPVKVSGFAASRAFRVERLRFFYFVRVLRGVFVLEIRLRCCM